MHRAPAALGSIRPRVMGFRFDEVPRHWMGGQALATAMANGLNLVFPLGERFFIRSVRHYMDQVDEDLRKQVKGFFGQEGRHAHEHERFFEIMESQGYEIRRFLRIYEAIAYRGIERLFGPKMHLAVTVALEHYTAIMAENAFAHGLLDRADPSVRELLAWHAAEEIEHKAVAFDVLQEVAPGYGLRMAGMAMATVTLIGFWALATAMLLRQEKDLSAREIFRQLRELQEANPIGRRVFARGLREYARPDFHPWDTDNLALARDYLAQVQARVA
ncbi:MAG: metal-dependent hydrolase [Myxococcales bacterium]|nr:metal-dependent hydrolase [Myxococcales bacterium]MCB9565878.1 metal-dependent hydrolase [Myxococcales bacterium]MCB9702937.1 metal-dependent hydrolase [Myxococcales bacterium]